MPRAGADRALTAAGARAASAAGPEDAYWALDAPTLLAQLLSGTRGLGMAEAQARLARHGRNEIRTRRDTRVLRLLARQFASPLVLVLVGAALVSLFVADWTDAATILIIVIGSTMLGFWQELRASLAVDRLRARLALRTRAWRDGVLQTVNADALVPGDVIDLAAGHLVPADGVLLEATDFLVVEASLTGESFPVEKAPGVAAAEAPLRERRGCVFLGSSVRSGTARVLVVRTGRATVMGEVAGRLFVPQEETEFARGVRRFGEMLVRLMLLVVIAVLVANQVLGRPAMDSLLFAMALAVGLSPELLPAIVSVSLATSARRLAGEGVLVRRLEAIEDLGGMDVLCTDKTGTLTVGVMALAGAVDADGAADPEVLRLAHLNAAFETGIDNPLDAALVQAGGQAGLTTAGWRKLAEIPYDFARKRLAIVAVPEGASPAPAHLIVKGACAQVLAICTHRRRAGHAEPLDDAERARLDAFIAAQGRQGLRVLALATREVEPQARYTVAAEAGMTLEGLLLFADPPKPDLAETLHALHARGVRVKMITGDSRHVAAHVAREVGLDAQAMLTGEQIAGMRDEALWHLAERTDLFVEVEPAQKERIVHALRRAGHAVGYLGDGINDAPALHAADVGISVDQAVDVARESADLVLLRPDLTVLLRGVEQGRRTFANTMKYITINIASNFGNMMSMAVATPLLPFLPMTASQILLNNLLAEMASLTLAGDAVDEAAVAQGGRWDVAQVRRFMIAYGLVSSVFDGITFWLLLCVFEAGPELFRSAWFVASLLTELAVVLVLRTQLAAWRSRPAPLLLLATLATAVLAVALPYTPAARLFALQPIPAGMLGALLAVVLVYVFTTEAVKQLLHARAPLQRRSRRPRGPV